MTDILNKQQRKFEDYSEKYRDESNQVFTELVKQLILAATVFLSISVLIFNIQDIHTKIGTLDKHLLAFAWILLGVSIMSGIGQFVIDHFFFRKWAKAKFSIVEGIYCGEINEKNLTQKIFEKQKEIPDEASGILVILQATTVIISISLLIFVMTNLLFRI